MTTTKRQRERRLEQVEQAVESASSTTDASWTVEQRDAAPETRPEGMVTESDNRTIAYDFWEGQQECLEYLDGGDLDIVAFLGGYRSGKSVTGARWTITEALRNPGERFIAMGTSYSEAVSTTYRVLFENLPGDRTHIVTSSFSGPENSPIVADYNRAEHRLTLFNDSVIILGSADKWSRYAGDEYAGIWLDEPSHYGSDLHDLLEMMSTRLTASQGPKCMFWTLTGNGYNAAWEILEQRQDADGGDLGHRIELVRASVLDNPYIATEDKESLRRQFEGGGREEQALLGGFASAQGLVYGDFRRDIHVIDHAAAVDAVTDDWRVFGYDAGWRDPRVVLEVGKTAYGQLVILDEFYRSESYPADVITWLADKPRGYLYCEHEPSDIRKFRSADLPAVKAKKSLDSGITEVRRRLDTEGDVSISDACAGLDDTDTPAGSRVGLVVSERCEHVIQEFHSYKREQVGSAAAEDHCLDSLRYLCHGIASGGVIEREQSHKRKSSSSGVRTFGTTETTRSLSLDL